MILQLLIDKYTKDRDQFVKDSEAVSEDLEESLAYVIYEQIISDLQSLVPVASMGVEEAAKRICTMCNGDGFTTNGVNKTHEDYREEDCEYCNATGYVAGAAHVQQQPVSGAGWVKASDRLPGWNMSVKWRHIDYPHEVDNEEMWTSVAMELCAHMLSGLEWFDEHPTASSLECQKSLEDIVRQNFIVHVKASIDKRLQPFNFRLTDTDQYKSFMDSLNDVTLESFEKSTLHTYPRLKRTSSPYREALEKIVDLCAGNESSVELVGKIEKIADEVLTDKW